MALTHEIYLESAIKRCLVKSRFGLYSATERKRSISHALSKMDLIPNRSESSEGERQGVPYDDIVRGRTEDGGYGRLWSDEELAVASLKIGTTRIHEFRLMKSEISILYFDQPYYLRAGKSAVTAYSLLLMRWATAVRYGGGGNGLEKESSQFCSYGIESIYSVR